MSPITPKQKQVFEFIGQHIESQGFAPSQQEIAKAFGFRSLGTVQNYLVRLEREGLLSRDWNGRRSLRLAAVTERGMQLPLAGTVAAGKPIEAIETSDTIDVPPAMVGAGEHFVLHVAGDSMIDDGIL
ncbi:MAG: repressor LexA, partial [Desulfuromonadaceae bacterium]|nr:repressor LexA [Desulfuromonadaceae bacterium]